MWKWPFAAALNVFSVLKSYHLILTFAVNLLLASFSSPTDLVMLQCSLQRPPGKLHYRWATWLCICQTPLLCWLCVLFGISKDTIRGVFCSFCFDFSISIYHFSVLQTPYFVCLSTQLLCQQISAFASSFSVALGVVLWGLTKESSSHQCAFLR